MTVPFLRLMRPWMYSAVLASDTSLSSRSRTRRGKRMEKAEPVDLLPSVKAAPLTSHTKHPSSSEGAARRTASGRLPPFASCGYQLGSSSVGSRRRRSGVSPPVSAPLSSSRRAIEKPFESLHTTRHASSSSSKQPIRKLE